MKKLLFISSKSSVLHIPIWKAFENFGYEVHFVDFRGHPFLEIGNLAHRALNKLPKKISNYFFEKSYKNVDQLILKRARELKPDLIFATKAKYISLPVVDELRTIAPTANWYVDQMSNWTTIKNVVDHYDYLFNYDRYVIDLLRSKGHKNAYHLPWAGYLEKTAKWPEKKDYKYNIIFIGSYHPTIFPRESSFDGLKELGLNIWGNGSWRDTPLRDCYQGVIEHQQELVQKVYQESKIAIYLDSIYDTVGTGVTLRPFEITAGGSMMLGQVYRQELPELFEAGKEFISFVGTNKLKAKAEYYLSHEEERKKIARAGFERTRSEHTYIDRIKKVLDIINSH